MSLLWWQNGRDIDWFSNNLEKWIKPGAVSNIASSQQHGGRYSKLKSCRLSKTCQTMMYIPQDPHPRDISYEEQLARFQDDRAYKYSQRQSHYNSHYNYIRTTARRAYFKPETNEIVLADEYDKIQTIQRQNRAKNYDYLLLLQQFLKHQEIKVKEANCKEDIGTMTSYLNNNIEQYEKTDQTMTLKQFLQEGIEKYEQDNLVTLKEFLQENTSKAMNHTQGNALETEKTDRHKESDGTNTNNKRNECKDDVTLQEFLQEECDLTFSSTNPFASDISTSVKRNNPFISISSDEDSSKTMTDTNDVSFEEFLRERQIVGCQNVNTASNIQKINYTSPIHTGSQLGANTRTQSVDSNDKISFDEFLKERRHHLSPKKSSLEEDKELSLEEFLRSEALLSPHEIKLEKSNEYKAKVKNINLKLSKSFNDRTNLLKENLIKKLTRNDYPSENDKTVKSKKEHTIDHVDENKITLYEFLKEEEQKQTTEIEHGLKNLQLKTKHDGETFYEINNNSPDIKVNDNFIEIETKTPTIKYSQYEHNKQVCACDNQLVLTGKIYNQNYSQSQLFNNIDDKIEFIDKNYDYHRSVQQNEISSIQQKANNKLLDSMHTQGRKTKSRTKPYNLQLGGVEDRLYAPVWPSVLLTYDKVVSPNRQGCLNESYA